MRGIEARRGTMSTPRTSCSTGSATEGRLTATERCPTASRSSITYASQTTATAREFEELWKKAFDSIGIRMNVEKGKFSDQIRAAIACKHQMWSYGWIADYPDGDNFMQLFMAATSARATSRAMQSPTFDALYEKSRLLPDSPDRDTLFEQMTRQFEAESPWRLGTANLPEHAGAGARRSATRRTRCCLPTGSTSTSTGRSAIGVCDPQGPIRPRDERRIAVAPRSPIISDAAFVLADVTVGMTDASTTRKPSTPRTRSCGIDDGERVVGAAHPARADAVEHRPARVPREVEHGRVGLRLADRAGSRRRRGRETRAAHRCRAACGCPRRASCGRRSSSR